MNPYAPISDIMITDVISISPREKIRVAEDIFARHRIHHIPVVETDNTLVGIISKIDFLKMTQKNLAQEGNMGYENMINSLTVADIMTSKVAKLTANDKIDVAARLFHENLFHAVPIVNGDNKLVGIITSYDLVEYTFKEVWKGKPY